MCTSVQGSTVGPQVSAVGRETEGTCDCGAPERLVLRLPPIAVVTAGGSASRPSVVPSGRACLGWARSLPGGKVPRVRTSLYRQLHSTRVKCPNRNLKLLNLA